jgi:hypothetical protein
LPPALQPSQGGRPGTAGVTPGVLGTLGGLGFVGVVGVPPVVVSGFAVSPLRPPRKLLSLYLLTVDDNQTPNNLAYIVKRGFKDVFMATRFNISHAFSRYSGF